jgi:hypothetical protein
MFPLPYDNYQQQMADHVNACSWPVNTHNLKEEFSVLHWGSCKEIWHDTVSTTIHLTVAYLASTDQQESLTECTQPGMMAALAGDNI